MTYRQGEKGGEEKKAKAYPLWEPCGKKEEKIVLHSE